MNRILKAIPTVLLSAGVVSAAGPSHWIHSAQSDFNEGHFENVVATNLGDLKLSRRVQTLLEQDPRISTVYALAEMPNGDVYAGTGPNGVLLKISNGQVTTAAEFNDGDNIFALLVDKATNELLIGVSGESARLYRLKDDEPVEVFSDDTVQYIWAIQQASDNKLYLATGPDGKLFELDQKNNARVVYDSDERNLLSLIIDKKDQLIVGTDPNGLLFRIDRRTGEAFVLYDAAESEISTLAIDDAGNIYAGTAAAVGSSDGYPGMDEIHPGRPEVDLGEPIPTQEPDFPEPPELPDPSPNEPDPIPQHPEHEAALRPATGSPKNLLVLDSETDLQEGDAPPSIDGGDDDGAPGAPGDGEEPPAATPEEPQATTPTVFPAGGQAATPAEGGNAIYRIDPNGFVHEVFRDEVLVLSLIEQNGTLLVGTGSGGLIYSVRPAAEETLVLAKVEPQQVMSLLRTSKGMIYVGLANTGGLATLSEGYADAGSYTSSVLDAQQISRWGHMNLQGLLPAGTSLKVSTRSGNTADPDGAGWSTWSDPVNASRFVEIKSPTARFLQYKLDLTAGKDNTTPTIEELDIPYQGANQPPAIHSVTVMNPNATTDPSQPIEVQSHYTISWSSSDPDGDSLAYKVEYRRGRSGPWIQLADKITASEQLWNIRSIVDGRYQVRVTANDKAGNPSGAEREASRVSDPVVVDNTPPVIGDLSTEKTPTGIHIRLRAVDRTSTISAIHYSVNASDDWHAVPASDNIYDTPDEGADFTVEGLSPGIYQVTVRVTDSQANAAYQNLPVVVEKP